MFGGRDGLVVVEPLVTVAATLLAPGGTLAVEHDDTTSAAVAAVVSGHGGFGTVERHTDLAGRPRFVTATRLDDDGDDHDGDEQGAGVEERRRDATQGSAVGSDAHAYRAHDGRVGDRQV